MFSVIDINSATWVACASGSDQGSSVVVVEVVVAMDVAVLDSGGLLVAWPVAVPDDGLAGSGEAVLVTSPADVSASAAGDSTSVPAVRQPVAKADNTTDRPTTASRPRAERMVMEPSSLAPIQPGVG